MGPTKQRAKGSGMQMAKHLSFGWGPGLGPSTLGTPISMVFWSSQSNPSSISVRLGWGGLWEKHWGIPLTTSKGRHIWLASAAT